MTPVSLHAPRKKSIRAIYFALAGGLLRAEEVRYRVSGVGLQEAKEVVVINVAVTLSLRYIYTTSTLESHHWVYFELRVNLHKAARKQKQEQKRQ